MSAHLELAHMTRDEVAELAADKVLVLPTAATEQHGPHLPLGTDAILGEAVAREALRVVRGASTFVLAPVQWYGSSHHHLAYSALSLSTQTFLASVTDLLESALTSGFRRIYVLNSHGGNVECVRLAARDVALGRDSVIGSCSYWDVSRGAIDASGLWSDAPLPGHAGQFETSMMLAVAPEFVRLDRLPPESHSAPVDTLLRSEGSSVHRHGEWERSGGYTDVPRGPSKELGKALLKVIGESVAAALSEFDDISMRIGGQPNGR